MSELPTRWWIVGSSGAGKTTYARAVATAVGAPHLELDALYHQPGWTPLEREEFRARVGDVVAAAAWVIDGNYGDVRDVVRSRAQIIVALDLPRATVMRQLVARTWRRGWRREELWNGNRERLGNFLRWDPERSVLRWSWTQYHATRDKMRDLELWSHDRGVTFVRVRSHDDAHRALASLAGVDATCFLG